MFNLFVIVFGFFAILSLASGGHEGHSESYKEYLNQPTPVWLKIGEPTEAEIVEGAESNLPPLSGTVIAYPVSVSIPANNITITFQGQVAGGASWGAKKDNWLSPDGRRLIVQAEGAPRVFEVLGEESYREIDVDIPDVTYGSSLRGQLFGWCWVSDDVLVGNAVLENQDSGEYEGIQIYVYHVEEKVLSRLNLESLNLSDLEGLEIVQIESETSRIQFRIGDESFTVKAGLKMPSKLLPEQRQEERPSLNSSSADSSSSTLPEISKHQPVSEKPKGNRWLGIITSVLLLVILALSIKLWKGKSVG